jgi:hypothetical protein
MEKISQTSALFPLLIIVTLSLTILTINLAVAQSIPKPSVPEFTVKYVDHSYDTPATYGTDPYTGKTVVTTPSQHVDNRTVEFKIKNQAFTAFTDENGTAINLFFNIRYKGSYEENWTSMFGSQGRWFNLDNPYLTYGYPTQDNSSQYTTVIYQLPWNIVEGQMDFQVEALEGYTEQSLRQGGIIFAIYDYTFYGQKSGWSNTKTVTLGEATNSNTPIPTYPPTLIPNPTVSPAPAYNVTDTPDTSISGNQQLTDLALIAAVVVLAVAVVSLLVYVRKIKNRLPT